MAEASGEMEARDQLPLRPYAPAGSLFERVLRRMSIDRQILSVTNCIRCRPRNNWLEGNPHEYSALAHCRPNLDAAIAERRPKAILALGGVATRELTGLAGDALGVTHLAGYVLSGPNNIPVVPDFHPAFLRRGKASYQGVFARILQRAINIAKGTDRQWMWNVDPDDILTWGDLHYRIHPALDEAWEFANYVLSKPQSPLAEDLETNESASLDEDAREGFADTFICLAQFCIRGEDGRPWAIAIPYEEPFLEVIRVLLHSPNPKYGHNWNLFDHKVLRAAAAREGWRYSPTAPIFDTLDMFHHWQPDLPAHLQFAASFVQFPFPWKHLAASHIEWYGCADVHSDLLLGEMLEKTLRRDGVWGDHHTGYIGQVAEVRPVLAAMEDRGMPIDDAARIKLGDEFEIAQADIGRKIAAQVPYEIGRVHPKEGYKGIPPEVKKYFAQATDIPELDILAQRFTESCEDPETYRYEQRQFDIPDDNLKQVPTLRWCRVYDFNPNSRPQVISYMEAKGHPVPKDKHRENEDGDNPDTTNEKELRRLANKTGDTFYLDVIEYRGMTKLRGTYVDGFAPGADGCVHTTFTFSTAIGQLASRNPNTQNFPKLKPTVALARAMRAMVAAKPGKIITEWDYKSCHVITLGFLAEDLNYMRLGRLDIHSFVAGHFLNLWDGRKIIHESDAELLARFKWLKSDPIRKRVRDDQAKHGILGIGNGLKAKGLYERYMESFPPQPCTHCVAGKVPGIRGLKQCPECKGAGFIPGQRVAEGVLQTAELLFPGVFAWQKRIQRLAHDQQFLRTEFGHLRRFFEVFRWDTRRNDWGHGDQAEEAIAYWLSNIAHSHLRLAMKEIDARGFAERYGLFNQIHDAVQFHFDESLLEEHTHDIYGVLTQPSPVLRHPSICPDGLTIGVEGSWGYKWANMNEIDISIKEASHVL